MTDTTSESPQGALAYRRLIEEIRTGKLLPDMRLRETEIAERFGLSRTPVREAIRMLEADGLVEHLPRQGASIRRLDYAEVMELYEMRSVFEGTAARLAASAASEVELRALELLNTQFAASDDAHEAAELNQRFHMTLLNCARNRFLARSVASVQKTMMILGPTTLMKSERVARAVEEHRAILDAMTARDGLRAEAEMRAHIEPAQLSRLRQMPIQPGPNGL